LNQLSVASRGSSPTVEGRALISLLIQLDSDASSFCYYPTVRPSDRRVMNAATLADVLGFVSRHQLAAHFLCGSAGIQPDLLPLLDTVSAVTRVAPGQSSSHARLPHPTPSFSGRTPDEMFFGNAANVPEDPALAKSNARAARMAANRAMHPRARNSCGQLRQHLTGAAVRRNSSAESRNEE
jgi:hypothetical protein